MNTFLPMRNKFVYSCSIKIHASGFDELLESIFRVLLVVKTFCLQKVVKMLEEEVVSWWQFRWIWWMRQNFVAQFIQPLKHWLCDVLLSIAVENWDLSVDQCWPGAWQFLVHLINLPSILLRWTGFAAIQKAVEDQTGRKPPKSAHDHFLVQVWFWKELWSFFLVHSLSWSSLVVIWSPFCITYPNLIKMWLIVVA